MVELISFGQVVSVDGTQAVMTFQLTVRFNGQLAVIQTTEETVQSLLAFISAESTLPDAEIEQPQPFRNHAEENVPRHVEKSPVLGEVSDVPMAEERPRRPRTVEKDEMGNPILPRAPAPVDDDDEYGLQL